MTAHGADLQFFDQRGVVVVCGSMTHFANMHRLSIELQEEDIPAELPDAEGEDIVALDEERYRRFVRMATLTHLKRVRSRRTFAVLVANFDKHGIEDYIGPNTFAEVAAAAARGKRIFVLNDFPTIYSDLLHAWRAVPLHGRLSPLIHLYREACTSSDEMKQFSFQV